MMYCYKSCTFLKSIHCNLMSSFNVRHSMFTHTPGMWKTRSRRFPRGKGERGKSIWEFLFQLKKFLGFIGILLLWSNHTNSNWSRIWLSRRPFCSSTTPNPPTTKVVKPRTKSKRKMRRCSILMQQWIIWNCRLANSSRLFYFQIVLCITMYYAYHRFRQEAAEVALLKMLSGFGN